jgi:glycerate 2-kinase
VSERDRLTRLHRAALDEVHAGRALARALEAEDPGPGPYVLLAAGKAACAMAEAARRALGDRITRGAVTTKDGHARPQSGLACREAGHPLPDSRSEAAGREALSLAAGLAAHESLLVLISGGASALWCVPADGLTLAEKRETTSLLLRASLPIGAVNTVRRHLSALKGGELVRAARGRRVRVYAVSDVPGDALADIGSGPAAPDPTHFGDGLQVLRARGLVAELPAAVRARLERGTAGEIVETLKPGDPEAASVTGRVVASLDAAIAAVVREAAAEGLRTRSLGRALDADVATLAEPLAAEIRRARADGVELLVAGGEPTVAVRGEGLGGRAQELAVRLSLAVAGEPGWTALCAGTDGTDGPTDAAGAFADSALVTRARTRGLDPARALATSDVHPLLTATGDLFHTGPTETNVADLFIARVQPG